MKTSFFLFFAVFGLFLFGQNQPSNSECYAFQNGVYTYKSGKDNYIVSIKGKKHIDEKLGHGTVVSKINWFAPCHASLTVKQVSIEGYPLKKGDVMLLSVKIVEDKTYTTWVAAKGNSGEGVLTRK